MTTDTYKPFDADVEAYGGYQYAQPSRRSAVVANRRFSDIIVGSVDLDGKRVVDVGCGDGTYTRVLRRETGASHILGIDPAARAIGRAREGEAPHGEELEFRNCYAEDLVREGARFDVAIYRGVIHHVGDPAAEIATALRLAREVFFLEPNGWNPVVKLLERFSAYHREHEERSFRLRQYRKWVRQAGGHCSTGFYFGLVPMFCPAWFVPLAALLEPLIERVPVVRSLACGQLGILATGPE